MLSLLDEFITIYCVTLVILNNYKAINTSFFCHKALQIVEKMPKIDTLDALEEQEEHEDDYQTNSNW